MNFRFDNILEDWAVMYSSLRHDRSKDSKHKRFFRIRDLKTDNEFMRNANTTVSPLMLFSILVDAVADGHGKTVTYRYEIFFASKGVSSLVKTSRQDEMVTTDQQHTMDEMVQDLLGWLWEIRKNGICPVSGKRYDDVTVQSLKGLRLERAEWASLPVKYNDWHFMGLMIDGVSPRLLCVNREKYNI